MSSLGSQSACRASAVVLLILYLAQLVLCAVVRPFTTLFSHVYALFTLALITIAAACQVWYLFGSVASGVDLVALSRLLIAAAVCDIVVSGVSILKSLIDAVDVLKACRRHITVMFPMLVVKTSSEEIHPKPLAEDTWNNSDAVIISEIKSPPVALLGNAIRSSMPRNDKRFSQDPPTDTSDEAQQAEDASAEGTMASLFSSLNDSYDDDDGTIVTAKEKSTYHVHHDLLHFYSHKRK